jgi:hypothetical protein
MAGLAVIAGVFLLAAEAPDPARDAAQTTADSRRRPGAVWRRPVRAPTEGRFGDSCASSASQVSAQAGRERPIRWDGDSNATPVIWRGQSSPSGRFVEWLVAIDADRSSSSSHSRRATRAAGPSSWRASTPNADPVSLMRVVSQRHALQHRG